MIAEALIVRLAGEELLQRTAQMCLLSRNGSFTVPPRITIDVILSASSAVDPSGAQLQSNRESKKSSVSQTNDANFGDFVLGAILIHWNARLHPGTPLKSSSKAASRLSRSSTDIVCEQAQSPSASSINRATFAAKS
jgi:hypothetical protein